MKETKNILVKVFLKGKGVVNFDSNEYIIKKQVERSTGNYYKNDNVAIAKSAYQKRVDENGKLILDKDGNVIVDRKLKISTDCFRHAMFMNDSETATSTKYLNDMSMAHYISSPEGLARGFMNINNTDNKDKKDNKVNKKTALNLLDFESDDAVITLSIGTRSGEKESLSEDKKSNSLFYKETVGEAHYKSCGNIDFKQLEFMAIDDIFERQACPSRLLESGILEQAFYNHYKRVPYTIGHYNASHSLTKQESEYGLHFDQEFRKQMAYEILIRILQTKIWRRGSVALIDKVLVKAETDDINADLFNDDETGWTKITNGDDIKAFLEPLELKTYYTECESEK